MDIIIDLIYTDFKKSTFVQRSLSLLRRREKGWPPISAPETSSIGHRLAQGVSGKIKADHTSSW